MEFVYSIELYSLKLDSIQFYSLEFYYVEFNYWLESSHAKGQTHEKSDSTKGICRVGNSALSL